MSLTNKDLLAISQLFNSKIGAYFQATDGKLDRIEKNVDRINITLDYNVIPRLQNIEICNGTFLA